MEKTVRAFLWDHVLSMSAYWVCTGAVIAKFTDYFSLPLGISNFLTGLSSSFLIFQLAGGLWYARTRSRHGFLLVTNLVWRLGLVAVFLSVLLPLGLGALVAVALITVMSAAYQLSNPAQLEWQISGVEGRTDARYYTQRDTIFMLVYTVSMCAAEALIALFERRSALRDGFLWIALLEGILLTGSLLCLHRLPPPAASPKNHLRLGDMFLPLRDKRFSPVLWLGVWWSFASVFGSGFSNLYAVRILRVDFVQIMIWSAVGNLLRAACTPLSGRIARSMGWKRCMALQVLLSMLIAGGWFLCTPHNASWLYPLLVSLTSIPIAGFGLGLLRFQVAASPDNGRSVYLAVYSAVNGGLAMAGTVLCSALVGLLDGIGPEALCRIFLLCVLLMLLPLYCLRRISFDLS